MESWIFVLICTLCLIGPLAEGFVGFSSAVRLSKQYKAAFPLLSTPSASDAMAVSSEIPSEIAAYQTIGDHVLVERFGIPEKTSAGIFLTSVEGKDQKWLGKVLSVPQSANFTKSIAVGDVVVLRDAWGVGPKHIELQGRFFSFHQVSNILAKIDKEVS